MNFLDNGVETTTCKVCAAVAACCGLTPDRYYQCGSCGFVFTNAFHELDSEASGMKNGSDARLKTDLRLTEVLPETYAKWVDYYFGRRKDHIPALAYGPGGEKLASILRTKGWNFDVWNTSDALPPGAEEKFKLITAFDAFEYVSDPEHLLRCLERQLADEGAILFSATLHNGPLNQTVLDARHAGARVPVSAIYSETSLKTLFEQRGFTLHSRFEPCWHKLHIAFRTPPLFARGLLPEEIIPPEPVLGAEKNIDAFEALVERQPDNIAAKKQLGFLYVEQGGAGGSAARREKIVPIASGRILICVPAYNRKKITGLVLESLMKYKKDATLWVYNDWSVDYDNDFLEPLCDRVIKLPQLGKAAFAADRPVGSTRIGRLRWHQCREFLQHDSWDYLYLTDNDALHDPDFIDALTATHAMSGNLLPSCLYNGPNDHIAGNIVRQFGDFTAYRSAPGVSHFYSKDMVRRIVAGRMQGPRTNRGWDSQIHFYLGLPYLKPNTSWLEHFGADQNAIHSKANEWNRDRAINPSPYLQKMREPVIAYVMGTGQKPEV